MAADGNGAAAAGGDTRAAFAQIYKTLKEELLTDPAFEFTEESHQWIDRVTTPLPLPPSLSLALAVVLPFMSLFPGLILVACGGSVRRRRGPASSPHVPFRFHPGSAGSL